MMEEFFANYRYTTDFFIGVLTVIGTCGATIVALWLSYKADKPKLHVFFDIDMSNKRILIFIRNIGNVPIHFSNPPLIYWQLRCIKTAMIPFPKSKKHCLWTINPGELRDPGVDLDFDNYENNLLDLYNKSTITRFSKFLKCYRRLFPVIFILRASGKVYKTEVSPSLKDEFAKRNIFIK